MEERIVIVGAGQAGGELAAGLRKQGHQGRIVLLGDEPHPPYQRPPLSKGFLQGKVALSDLYLKPLSTYERFDIELRLGTRVEAIDRSARELSLQDGSRLGYDKLVLATGGRARRLSLPGMETAELENLFSVRSISDIETMRAKFVAGNRLLIIGGGYIGLEVAAVAVQLGLQVTVLEAAPRLLSRVTGPEVSTFIEELHHERGVEFRLSCEARGLELDEARQKVRGVHVARHGVPERLDADLVLVGIGLVPNTELASGAGLAVDDGIVVDEYACSADPAILAIGDCANQPSAYMGGRIRLESVPNAIEHARVAAATLMGKREPYAAIPWFWSDQYGLKLQMVGLSAGYEQCITRGSAGGKEFSAFYLKDKRVIAADVIGRPADFMAAKRLVSSRAQVEVTRLGDAAVPLASLAA
ncbi:NAD(P)/FAD-dependent oxidoreductase [Polyangium jinanense]|uniref:FAD-dependent oxidoreductase n=1 Tax=Polyangium jinanense TaxID=2829994 RepID=A0A9X3X1M2_9BACT|nr:FAD-dependent oxidoreductase [Polyangium jinanense]MDC3953980.1 FAD-dependent oxidoreductase [Polyangium jinanense]MDC3957807.1 FAD-dependent oxidoreductase [Polyangium jinanense]MDC3978893.1 FAD-dependent oxidoreductase [Polyangium jinanense]MDC3982064.1 FAD-dependent oxidoreductase [Polyangium jinanense]